MSAQMATMQDAGTTSATQAAITADQMMINHLVQGDLVAKQNAYQSKTGLESPLYSSDPSDLQCYAQSLDTRSLEAEAIEGIKQFIHERDGDVRYVVTLLLGAKHVASSYLGLIVEFNKVTGDLSIMWSYLDLREPTSEALERGSFGC